MRRCDVLNALLEDLCCLMAAFGADREIPQNGTTGEGKARPMLNAIRNHRNAISGPQQDPGGISFQGMWFQRGASVRNWAPGKVPQHCLPDREIWR
jgi:hypothetical protein